MKVVQFTSGDLQAVLDGVHIHLTQNGVPEGEAAVAALEIADRCDIDDAAMVGVLFHVDNDEDLQLLRSAAECDDRLAMTVHERNS